MTHPEVEEYQRPRGTNTQNAQNARVKTTEVSNVTEGKATSTGRRLFGNEPTDGLAELMRAVS